MKHILQRMLIAVLAAALTLCPVVLVSADDVTAGEENVSSASSYENDDPDGQGIPDGETDGPEEDDEEDGSGNGTEKAQGNAAGGTSGTDGMIPEGGESEPSEEESGEMRGPDNEEEPEGENLRGVEEQEKDTLSETAKAAIESSFDLFAEAGGTTISAYPADDGIYYLFVPNNAEISGIELKCCGFRVETASRGEIDRENNSVRNAFEGNEDTVVVASAEGDAYTIEVMQAEIPSIMISLSGTDLQTINAGSKEIKYEGNTVTLIDESGNAACLSNVMIKGRGNSTWNLAGVEKKPYQLKFEKKTSVFGMEKAKKWNLLAGFYDESLMRTQIAFETAKNLGMAYTTDYRFANVWVDGEYIGLYMIGEKIEAGSGRVELSHPQGCVYELDNEFYQEEEYSFHSIGGVYVVKDSVSEAEADILAAEAGFQNKLKGLFEYIGTADQPTVAGMSQYIDVASFVQYYLLTEYFCNAESFVSSNYYYQDGPEDVIHAGPVWDYDCSMGNQTSFDQYVVQYSGLMDALMGTEAFREYAAQYYENVRNVFQNASGLVSELRVQLNNAAGMNYKRWNMLGKSLPGQKVNAFHPSYQAAADALESWLNGRYGFFRVKHPVTCRREGSDLVFVYNPDTAVNNITFATWTNEGGQDDLKWTKAAKQADGTWKARISINSFRSAGLGNVHVYSDGKMINRGSFYCSLASSKTAVSVSDISGNETTIRVAISGAYPSGTLSAAVWSVKKGQDDLIWYRCKQASEGNWYADIPVSRHKTEGTYLVHFYDGNGFLNAGEFSISAPTLEVSAENNGDGTGTVSVSNVSSASGVKNVAIAVWSAGDQSNLKWYTVSENSNGVYALKFDIANHQYKQETYYTDVYVNAGNGLFTFGAGTTVKVTAGHAEISAEAGSSQVRLTARKIPFASDYKNVVAAVWGDPNGQDDLKWYTCSLSGSTAVYDWKPDWKSDNGKYYAHFYGNTKNGQMVFLGGTTFTYQAVLEADIRVTVDKAAGTFTAVVNNLNSSVAASKVIMPTWCQADQNDIVWYTMNKSGNSYTVSGSISRHKYHMGEYKFDFYVSDAKGSLKYLGGRKEEIRPSVPSITAKISSDGKKVTITCRNLIVPAGAKSVVAPVWSKKNGQDDLKWHQMSENGSGDYTVTFSRSQHPGGECYADIYAVSQSGEMLYCGGTTF